MHWSVLAKVKILSQPADLPFPRKCSFCILGHFWHMITSSMRSPQPPALLCNLCFVTFLECSKSNGIFLKVLAKNLDCEKKKSQKVLLRVAPPCNFHKQLFSSHKMFDKKRLITTRHRGKHFCSRSFWASNFYLQARQSSKLMLTTGCAKWGHEFCILFGIHILFLLLHMGILCCAATLTLTETNCSPSSLKNSLIQPNHD